MWICAGAGCSQQIMAPMVVPKTHMPVKIELDIPVLQIKGSSYQSQYRLQRKYQNAQFFNNTCTFLEYFPCASHQKDSGAAMGTLNGTVHEAPDIYAMQFAGITTRARLNSRSTTVLQEINPCPEPGPAAAGNSNCPEINPQPSLILTSCMPEI